MAALAAATSKARGDHILLHTFFPASPTSSSSTRPSSSSSSSTALLDDEGATSSSTGHDADDEADDETSRPQPTTYARVRASRPGDLPEDYGISSDAAAHRAGLFKVSADTAERIGQRYISPECAAVILDTLALRRNMANVAPEASASSSSSSTVAAGAPPISCSRPRRRRSSYRAPTTKEAADRIAAFAVRTVAPGGGKDGTLAKLAALGRMYDRFADNEHFCNPPSADEDDGLGFPPGSPTRPDAAEFGSPGRRRRDGAKRCSRCHKLKISGSGHGRSKCDDGYSISSVVPYPAAPHPDEGTPG